MMHGHMNIYHDARSPEHLSRCTVTWTFITIHGHVNIYHDARSPEHLSRSTVTWTFITIHGHLNIYHDPRSPERQIPCLTSALNFNYHVQFKAP